MNADHDAAGELLRRCYLACVEAAQPAAALRAPLRATPVSPAPAWIISVGKAASGMAAAITEWLGEAGHEQGSGVVVAPEPAAFELPGLQFVVGDHPTPGAASEIAARVIGSVIEQIPADAPVHVAISGGASSLMAAPLPGISMAELQTTFALLLGAGLDIHEMNAVRKRVARWSAGRLGVALGRRVVHVWVISDVPGDDLGSIGSGPCTGDWWTRDAVLGLVKEKSLGHRLPATVQRALTLETPKPDNPILAAISPKIVANNRTALVAASDVARQARLPVRIMKDALHGEAATMGRAIAAEMQSHAGARQLLLWGGETTVTIHGDPGVGGRAQELALAAAKALDESGTSGMLLSAGTDGRDGPTDAAGAWVDQDTWRLIREAGRDPGADLARHDAYRALDAAGALFRPGPTGTNVTDVAIALTGSR